VNKGGKILKNLYAKPLLNLYRCDRIVIARLATWNFWSGRREL